MNCTVDRYEKRFIKFFISFAFADVLANLIDSVSIPELIQLIKRILYVSTVNMPETLNILDDTNYSITPSTVNRSRKWFHDCFLKDKIRVIAFVMGFCLALVLVVSISLSFNGENSGLDFII